VARYCAGMGLQWFAVTLRLAGQGLGWAVPAYLALAFVCLVLAVIDAATGLLPNRITYPAFPVVAGLLLAASLGLGELLARAGHAASDASLARLAATLQAAATADEPTWAALAEGRLAGDLDPAGFGRQAEAAALAARRRAEELADAARELAEQAAATATQARRQAEAAERDAEVLADRARLAEEAVRAAEDAHAAATAALEELQGRG
jgi:hypothetical protein